MFQKDEDKYMRKFGKMTADAQVDAIRRALDITDDQAYQVRQKIIDELKHQESLLMLAHQKAKLSESELERIKKIKLLCIRKKPARKEGRVHRIIRTNLFAEIKDLRERQVSWRHISEYIKQVHRIKIPQQSIRRVFTQLEKEFFTK